jgi:hypothetical protein
MPKGHKGEGMVAEPDVGLVVPGPVDHRWSGLVEYSDGDDAAVVDAGCVWFIASGDVTGASSPAAGLPARPRRRGLRGNR